LRREDRLHQTVELVAVLRHPDGCREADGALAGELRKRRVEQGSEDLADAVGAKIETQHGIAVARAAVIADHRRNDELVRDLVCIRGGDGSLRVRKPWT